MDNTFPPDYNLEAVVTESARKMMKEEEIVVNEKGGKQHKVEGRFDLIPVKPITRVAVTLENGAINYGEGNWRNIDITDHINHAIAHLFKYLDGDRSEDHLTNTICRTLFASELSLSMGSIQNNQGILGKEYEDTFPVDKNTKEIWDNLRANPPHLRGTITDIQIPTCKKTDDHNAEPCSFLAAHDGPCSFNIPF